MKIFSTGWAPREVFAKARASEHTLQQVHHTGSKVHPMARRFCFELFSLLNQAKLEHTPSFSFAESMQPTVNWCSELVSLLFSFRAPLQDSSSREGLVLWDMRGIPWGSPFSTRSLSAVQFLYIAIQQSDLKASLQKTTASSARSCVPEQQKRRDFSQRAVIRAHSCRAQEAYGVSVGQQPRRLFSAKASS